MANWLDRLNADPIPCLLEPDEDAPGVRYLALRDLVGLPPDDPELLAAQAAVLRGGPAAATLDAQDPEGYWVKPGAGYGPKYTGTTWSMLFLAQYGVDGNVTPRNISSRWFQCHYPLAYVTDMLLNLEVLAAAGCAGDPRLDATIERVLAKQDAQGRWPLEHHYHGKTWMDVGVRKAPDKWVTLRAVRVLPALSSPGDQ